MSESLSFISYSTVLYNTIMYTGLFNIGNVLLYLIYQLNITILMYMKNTLYMGSTDGWISSAGSAMCGRCWGYMGPQ